MNYMIYNRTAKHVQMIRWMCGISMKDRRTNLLLHRVIKPLSSIVLDTVSLNCRSSKEQECARSGHSNICLVFSDETPQFHVVSPS